jgi:hypothetical protein
LAGPPAAVDILSGDGEGYLGFDRFSNEQLNVISEEGETLSLRICVKTL